MRWRQYGQPHGNIQGRIPFYCIKHKKKCQIVAEDFRLKYFGFTE